MNPRFYLFLAAVIGLAGFVGRNHFKLEALREKRDRIATRAAQFEIPTGSASFQKRLRPDRSSQARLAAAKLIQDYKKQETGKNLGASAERPDDTSESPALGFMESLGARQIRMVIEEILRDSTLSALDRRRLIGKSVFRLVESDPGGALALFKESSVYLADTRWGRETVRLSLGNLAKENPQKAFEWARANSDEFSAMIDSAKESMIVNAAPVDLRLAFAMIREFGPAGDSGDLEASVLRCADTPELRTKAFLAVREHFAAMGEKVTPFDEARWRTKLNVSEFFAAAMARDGFEAGSKWLVAANPTPEERLGILYEIDSKLERVGKTGETVRWLEFIEETLPAKQGEACIFGMIRYWARNDFKAAEQWIDARPEGPIRNAAIRGFAETLAGSEPATAAQWALTLPPGKDRDETLKNIHLYWPEDDSAAREAFAKEHEIK